MITDEQETNDNPVEENAPGDDSSVDTQALEAMFGDMSNAELEASKGIIERLLDGEGAAGKDKKEINLDEIDKEMA